MTSLTSNQNCGVALLTKENIVFTSRFGELLTKHQIFSTLIMALHITTQPRLLMYS